MHKLVVLASLLAVVAVAHGVGLGYPAAGYGFIGGLTKLPNLGYGNVASVNSNQNTLGYQLSTHEHGPVSARSHIQSAHAPLGVGIPILAGVGHLGGLGGLGGYGLGAGHLGYGAGIIG